MRFFDREPTLWIAGLNAVIMVVGALGLQAFNITQAGLLVVVVNALFAAINAYFVRPISPAAFTYAIAAILAFAGSYGFNLSTELVTQINLVVVPILALLTRGQVSPANNSTGRLSEVVSTDKAEVTPLESGGGAIPTPPAGD